MAKKEVMNQSAVIYSICRSSAFIDTKTFFMCFVPHFRHCILCSPPIFSSCTILGHESQIYLYYGLIKMFAFNFILIYNGEACFV